MKCASTAISIAFSIALTISAPSLLAADRISIHLAHNSPREMETWQTVKQILAANDHTFTRKVEEAWQKSERKK